MQTLPYERNPGAKKSFLNAVIVETDCSSGPLSAMIIAPRIHCPQPIQPNSVSFSFRTKWDNIADMTTESAPRGVFRYSVKSNGCHWTQNGRSYHNNSFHEGVRFGNISDTFQISCLNVYLPPKLQSSPQIITEYPSVNYQLLIMIETSFDLLVIPSHHIG